MSLAWSVHPPKSGCSRRCCQIIVVLFDADLVDVLVDQAVAHYQIFCVVVVVVVFIFGTIYIVSINRRHCVTHSLAAKNNVVKKKKYAQ